MSIDVTDGRRLRSERSRERILRALRAALVDPELEFSPALVAARAGVSLSTVFRHFGDMEGLASAMRKLVVGEIVPILRAGFAGDVKTRILELVQRRVAVFETVGPLERAAQRHGPLSARTSDDERIVALLRAQVAEALGAAGAEPVLGDSIDALLSLGAWRHLRELRGLDALQTTQVLQRGVFALLGIAPPTGC